MNEQIKIPAELNYKNIYFISAYLLILLLSGFAITLYFLFIIPSTNPQIFITLIPCISFSICGSCIYYLRKLYKLLLDNKIKVINNFSLQKIGTVLYFIVRPLFAGIFSTVAILSLNSGLSLLSNTKDITIIFEGYIVISFFIGFSNGKFISYIENKSENIIDNI